MEELDENYYEQWCDLDFDIGVVVRYSVYYACGTCELLSRRQFPGILKFKLYAWVLQQLRIILDENDSSYQMSSVC